MKNDAPLSLPPFTLTPKQVSTQEDRFFVRRNEISFVRFPVDQIGTVILICHGGMAMKIPLELFEKLGLQTDLEREFIRLQ